MTDFYFILFLILAILVPSERKVWGIIFMTSLMIVINKNSLPHYYDSPLYLNRTLIIFIACMLLIRLRTIHAYYQASVYVMTLILFLLLEIDIVFVQNNVYERYEYFNYGIIIVKLLGVVIPVSNYNINKFTNSNINQSVN